MMSHPGLAPQLFFQGQLDFCSSFYLFSIFLWLLRLGGQFCIEEADFPSVFPSNLQDTTSTQQDKLTMMFRYERKWG